MLPKENRLSKKNDFNKIHKFGKFYGDSFLAIKILKNNLPVSRFGFLVGTKISKKAVVRNSAKRRLRESVRLRLKQIKPGYDIIFLTKPEIVGKSYDEIDEVVERILYKSNLIVENNQDTRNKDTNKFQYSNSSTLSGIAERGGQ